MSKINKKVLIIGAGAAGLAAGISAAANGAEVCIIEHSEKAGTKLLMTGNGHCNYTNTDVSPKHYHGDGIFVREVLNNFGYEDCINFFRSLLIMPKIKKYSYDDTGYVYPWSGEATSVRNALLEKLNSLNVKLYTNTKPEEIIFSENEGFTVKTSKGSYKADSLIVATGSNAYPKTGSDSSFYRFIKDFGHNFYTFMPALSMIKSNDALLKEIKGVRVEADVKLMVYSDNDMMMYDERGEVQFNENGISGIPVMQLSRYVPIFLQRRYSLWLTISLLPKLSSDELYELLKDRYKIVKENGYPEYMMLSGLIPEKLQRALIEECKIDFELEDEYIKELVKNIKELKFEVSKAPSFDQAQVCSGGVDTFEIDQLTMESKLVKNLYFVGEVLNIDGNCGGYNLHFAFATGYIAGRAAAGMENKDK
ncbi:MAG: aminoacetone oxidase family FAD-binding enzyme [Eubacteriales bacterium]|nr:aminoacetone oxidase family FAD-binding enzyme [Eubacteriales bacterium]